VPNGSLLHLLQLVQYCHVFYLYGVIFEYNEIMIRFLQLVQYCHVFYLYGVVFEYDEIMMRFRS